MGVLVSGGVVVGKVLCYWSYSVILVFSVLLNVRGLYLVFLGLVFLVDRGLDCQLVL